MIYNFTLTKNKSKTRIENREIIRNKFYEESKFL